MKRIRIPKLYEIGVRRPVTVLVAAFVLTILAFLQIQKLTMVMDLSDLLPPQEESVANLRHFQQHFGGLGFLVAVVEGPDGKASDDFAAKLAKNFEHDESVRYVEYKLPTEYFTDRLWLYLDSPDLKEMERRVARALELQKKGISPVFNDLMDFSDEDDRPDVTFKDIRKKYEERLGKYDATVKDGEQTLHLIWIKPKFNSSNLDQSRKLGIALKEIEAKTRQEGDFASVKVGYTGDYVTNLEEAEFTGREIGVISAAVTLLLFLILVLYFRRWSSALLIGLPLAVSVIWTGGWIYLFLGHLNLITGFAAAILAGLGSDYGIFLLTRYYQELDAGKPFHEAARLAFANTGRATFGSMLTTVGAFLALIFSHFGVFVEFGIVGAVGLLMNYLGMMLLMPALLSLAQRWDARPWFAKFAAWDGKFLGFGKHWRLGWEKIFFPFWAAAGILLTLGILTASAWTLGPQSRIYFEGGQLSADHLPGNQLYSRVNRLLGVTLKPTVLLVEGFDQAKRALVGLKARLEANGKREVFTKVVGLPEFIPDGQAEKQASVQRLESSYGNLKLVNAEQRRRVQESLQKTLSASAVTENDLPAEVKRRFISEKDAGLYALYLYPALGRQDSEELEKYYSGVEAARKDLGVNWKAVDAAFIQRDLLNLVSPEAAKGFGWIMAFFAIFLFLTVRPASRAFLIFLHLVATLILLSAAMYLLGIKLNVLNITVIPIVLGTGIDCFIHFSHRFDEEDDGMKVIRMDLPAIFISSLTSVVGFGGLILTSSAGLRSLGWVAVLGLSLMTLLCAFVFPRCLALSGRRDTESLAVEEGAS